MDPTRRHWIVRFQFFNTHGTEVTPGSDVVGEYVQNKFIHGFSLLVEMPEIGGQRQQFQGNEVYCRTVLGFDKPFYAGC
ncbi:MAG: hypothetical protein DHS20C12_12450 [Pseudohongiella sp.]|nr:MAG: hypothetical protein DHS20C12_12450 [Pseudohongiella sp.]